jgi:hypothetical protein
MANKLSPSTWLTTCAACAALGISDKQLGMELCLS